MTIPKWVLWIIALVWNVMTFAGMFNYMIDVDGFANTGTAIWVVIGGILGWLGLLICWAIAMEDGEEEGE